MSLRYTLTRTLLACALLGCSSASLALNLELAIMPGKVIQGHAKHEPHCDRCHKRFDRGAQPRLCQDCHKKVASDIAHKRGYHGRLKKVVCSSCHTDHKGRDARIVVLESRKFDHGQTDYPLRGKHRDTKCTSCHQAHKKYREAPAQCIDCHRKDDEHKALFGKRCATCHQETDWQEVTFKHDADTEFRLLGKHGEVACTECHAKPVYTSDTPAECNACHLKDDPHKRGLGTQCKSCHTEKSWKDITFDHRRDTRFRLRGEHATTRCRTCHTPGKPSLELPRDCYSCHRRDDPHKRGLGRKCGACHTERSWKNSTFDHDRKTRFRLRGEHATTRCRTCHTPKQRTLKLARDCYSCHAEDDRKKGHKGRYGKDCESCHNEKSFEESTFRHDRDTDYPLRYRHRKLACKECHTSDSIRDPLQTTCVACHREDDETKGHKGHYGDRCETCHIEKSFDEIIFDHGRDASWELIGKHFEATCKSCHVDPLDKVELDQRCHACHKDDDIHFGSYSSKCDKCHVADDWRKVDKRPQDD